MADIFVYLLLLLIVVWLGVRLFLLAPDHSQFDLPHVAFTGRTGEPSIGNEQLLELLREMHATIKSVPRRRQIAEMRRLMDAGFSGSPADAKSPRVSIDAVDAVLAIEYRLMPENARMDAVIDCQTAFRCMIDNGHAGDGEAREIYVSGDSAGGNLALMLAAWVRDEDLAPIDGVIAYSPATDSTLTRDSITAKIQPTRC